MLDELTLTTDHGGLLGSSRFVLNLYCLLGWTKRARPPAFYSTKIRALAAWIQQA